MTFVIEIEDLVANAFIETPPTKNRFLSYDKIEAYGKNVAEVLFCNGDHAKLILSRENTRAMYNNWSEFFEEKTEGGKRGVHLCNEVRVDDLIAGLVTSLCATKVIAG